MNDGHAAQGRSHLMWVVCQALAEDLGSGDVTSEAVVPAATQARGVIRAQQPGVLSGVAAAREVFRQVDAGLALEVLLEEGARFEPAAEVLRVRGAARSILSAERVALHVLQHLSGIATLTARFVERVRGTGVRILDTRKTTPGLRGLEKDAVRHGGGHNHRFGLYDAMLVKENHAAAAGGLTAALALAVAAARQARPPLPVVAEAHSPEDVGRVARSGADRVLLDNFRSADIARAVQVLRGHAEAVMDRRIQVEVSGGITLENVRDYALPGVDFISVGALTHSAPALDMSLELESEG